MWARTSNIIQEMVMLKKNKIQVLLVTCICLFLTLPQTGSAYEIVWKSGTLVPDGVGYANQIKDIFIPGLLKATDNKLYLKVYYGGVMGDDEDYLKKMRIGQLHGTGTSVQGALLACPEMGVVSLPMLFNGYDEVDYVKKQMYPVFDSVLNSKGFKLIMWLDQGFDQFYSVKTPLESLSQFKKTKFLTWCGEIEERFLDSMGASAIPVNVPEFNTSLRQGIADAYIGPPIWAVSTQMYTVIRHISSMNVRYSPSIFIVTMDAWNELPPKYQTSIMAEQEGWQTQFCQGSRIDNAKCLKAMFQYGLAEVTLTPEMTQNLRDRAEPIWQEMVDDLYPQDILDDLLAHLADYRESQ